MIEVLLPELATVSEADVIERFEQSSSTTVGDADTLALLQEVAKRLLRPGITRTHPELASLGFFLRERQLRSVIQSGSTPPDCIRVPRGRVFHVPPANVDTIFVYTWAISVVAGNANLVRISPRSGGAAMVVLDVLRSVARDLGDGVLDNQMFVRFERNDELVRALSLRCDLRFLWGGDTSVNALRAASLGVSARELTFPDRFSALAVSASAWSELSSEDKQAAAVAVSNDIVWFDQAACSSPRMLYWVGAEYEVDAARADFFAIVGAVIDDRGDALDTAMVIEQRVQLYAAAMRGATGHIDVPADGFLTATADPLVNGGWFGPRVFLERRIDDLAEIAGFATRRDQTLTHLGFSADALQALAHTLAGRGFDRIVPAGEALSFGSVWDGESLMDSATRLVEVRSQRRGR